MHLTYQFKLDSTARREQEKGKRVKRTTIGLITRAIVKREKKLSKQAKYARDSQT